MPHESSYVKNGFLIHLSNAEYMPMHSLSCGGERITSARLVYGYRPLALHWAVWNHASMNEDFEFEAVIQAGDGGGAFVFFPFDMQESFGTKGKVTVLATVDGVLYSGTLLKYGFPQHILGLLKDLRLRIGKNPGDAVKIILRKAS